MAYYLDLFSPETYAAFSASDKTVSGFRARHKKSAERLRSGDLLVCYLTRLSRWIGLLQVESGPFEDASPRFVAVDDPFVVRFRVQPLVWLDPDKGLPIHHDDVWHSLSITREHEKNSSQWTGHVRGSLNHLTDEDGAFLDRMLRAQSDPARAKVYALDADDKRSMKGHFVQRPEGGTVSVTVPDDADPEDDGAPREARESIRIQAMLAQIGAKMGMSIWLPANDRAAVLREWPEGGAHVLEKLPLNYDTTTLDTIERIDVLWLRRRAIARAFEVEHTTAIYSGLLRMADLLSLQPNIAIKLHIVAPESRSAKVKNEITRPVFSLLESGALSKSCTLLTYDSVREIANLEHLNRLSDKVLDDYAEEAGETD